MSFVFQFKTGSTADNDAYTGALGEITVDSDEKQLRLHDGSTAGGHVIGHADFTVGDDIDTQAILDVLDNKVSKVSGKGLSTNDYTDADKTKLADIDLDALGGIDQAVLDTKVDKVEGKGLSENDFTTPQRVKLDAIDLDVINALAQGTVLTVGGRAGHVLLTKEDVGLENVNNTADEDKLVSIPQQEALDLKVDKVEGKTLSERDFTTDDKIKLDAIDLDVINALAAGAVSSVAGRTGNVVLTKEDVGLENVDNTSDANKPLSAASQYALDQKVDKVLNKGLSQNDFTNDLKFKLESVNLLDDNVMDRISVVENTASTLVTKVVDLESFQANAEARLGALETASDESSYAALEQRIEILEELGGNPDHGPSNYGYLGPCGEGWHGSGAEYETISVEPEAFLWENMAPVEARASLTSSTFMRVNHTTVSPCGRYIGFSRSIQNGEPYTIFETATMARLSVPAVFFEMGLRISYTCAFSPSGRYFLFHDTTAPKLFGVDLTTNEPIPGLPPFEGDIYKLLFVESGQKLIVWHRADSTNNVITVINTANWGVLNTPVIEEPITRLTSDGDIVVSPNNEYLVGTAGRTSDPLIKINLSTWETTTIPWGDIALPNSVMALTFSPDGNHLAVGTRDTNEPVRLYNTTGWTQVTTFPTTVRLGTTTDTLNTLVFSNDGRWLVASASGTSHTSRATLVIYDFTTRTVLGTNSDGQPGVYLDWNPGDRDYSGVAFSQNDDYFYLVARRPSPYNDGVVRVFQTAPSVANWQEIKPTLSREGEGQALCYSPNGFHMAVAHTKGNYLSVLHTETLGVLNGTPMPEAAPTVLAYSPGANYLAVGFDTSNTTNNYLEIYSTNTWSAVFGVPTLPDEPRSIDWSPDGSLLAIACNAHPQGLFLFNRSDLSPINHTIDASITGRLYAAKFTPDNQYLIVSSVSSPYVSIISRSSWGTVATINERYSDLFVFSPTGDRLAVIRKNHTSGYVKLFNTSSWEEVSTSEALTGLISVHAAAWSPDGSTFVVGHRYFPYYTVFDTSTWQPKKVRYGVREQVLAVAFSNDGTQLSLGTTDAVCNVIFNGIVN